MDRSTGPESRPASLFRDSSSAVLLSLSSLFFSSALLYSTRTWSLSLTSNVQFIRSLPLSPSFLLDFDISTFFNQRLHLLFYALSFPEPSRCNSHSLLRLLWRSLPPRLLTKASTMAIPSPMAAPSPSLTSSPNSRRPRTWWALPASPVPACTP